VLVLVYCRHRIHAHPSGDRILPFQDAFGNTLSTHSAALCLHWDAMVEHVLAHGAAAAPELGKVLAADPEFALGHAARGLMLMGLARAECAADAAIALKRARECMRLRPVSRREAAFVEALCHWTEGQPQIAADRLEESLTINPRDALAFKLVHGIRFILGDCKAMLSCAMRHEAGFAGTPAHGYVLGCLAFAQEENHHFQLAERNGRMAIALQPRDAWGRHAVAHVMEMTGRTAEGSCWLRASTASWQHCNNFSYHIYWHLALFELELGRTADVLSLYDTEIRANRTDDYRDLANGASLLARLELEGVDVGNRWDELAEIASHRARDRRLVFADLHYLMALLGSGETAKGEALVKTLGADARSGRTHDARVASVVGEGVGAGLVAFHAADYNSAARHFARALPQLRQMGGSDAQRDVFEQIAIESHVRSGDLQQAALMLNARLRRRRGHNTFASKRLSTLAERAASRRSAASEAQFGALAIMATTIASAH
jgi:tetratricopeptide (TPR) repeat protein